MATKKTPKKTAPTPASSTPFYPPVSRFALHDFEGNPTEFFVVEREEMSTDTAVNAAPLSDLFLIFDRSGSMYSTIEDVKASALKTLTLSEFANPNLRVSLLTYSSRGDVKLHFHRVTVADIMATNSSYQSEIRSIRATAFTCISQSLEMVDGLVDPARMTGILMHTDGCANDSSPSAEKRAMEAAVARLRRHPRLFMNTVAHGSWADTNLLMDLSNKLSGRMLQASDQRGIYQAIHDTAVLLVGAPAPAIEIGMGAAQYATFVSRSAKKILGSADRINVNGVAREDDKTAYRYRAVTAGEYAALSTPVCGEGGASLEPVYAYALAQLSSGQPVRAKYALVATRNTALLKAHSKAVVPSALARFAEDLAAAVTSPNTDPAAYSSTYGLGGTGPSLMQIFGALNDHSSEFRLNFPEFTAKYRKRGLRRIPGVRGEDGTLTVPGVESKILAADPWVKVSGFAVNRDTATVNMLVVRPMGIFRRGTGERILKVGAGPSEVILPELNAFNNYTVVSKGEENVPALPLRIEGKGLHRALRSLGVTLPDYTPGMEVSIALGEFPLIRYNQTFEAPTADAVRHIFRMASVGKFLAGVGKGESTTYTAEQIAALKEVFLTPGMSFSPPTTTEYTRLEDAIANGSVDVLLEYAITVGLPTITSVSKLASGNAFLQRRFTLSVNGVENPKPTLDLVGAKGAVWGVKKLTARTTLTDIDAIMYPMFAGLLGLENSPEFDTTLTSAGVNRAALVAALTGSDRETSVAEAAAAEAKVNRALEAAYDEIRPLAFYIGASGLVPDSLGAQAMDLDAVEKTFPEAKLSKAEKDDGMFYTLSGGSFLTVYVKGKHFSTGAALSAEEAD